MQIKKILIINNGLAGGGIERASVSLANYFVLLGYKIDVLATYQSEHFYSLDSRITFTEPSFTKHKENRSIYVIKMMRYVRQTTKQINPDVILAYSEWTNPYVIISTIGLKIPIYVTDRMNPLANLPLISEIFKRLFYKRINGIVAQSEFAKSILYKRTKSKNIKVINNPVNLVERLTIEPKNRIVTVGRLALVKGHRFLIEAFAKVNNTDWELSIIGDGEERKRLEELAFNLGVAERVLFYGQLTDFSQQLSESKIFVLPSLKEGFPNALLEAMSIPLACITSDFFKGKNEIIEHGVNGFIVTPGNAIELADAINILINNSDLRDKLAKNAYRVREDYSFKKIAQQYLDFILTDK